MPTQRHSINVLVALFSAALATLFLIACQQSQPPTATSTQAELKPATTEIFVTFEGPCQDEESPPARGSAGKYGVGRGGV